jgi:hypothetical protein
LSGKLNTAFVERVKKDAAADGGGPHPPDLVNDAGGAAVAAPSGVVARRPTISSVRTRPYERCSRNRGTAVGSEFPNAIASGHRRWRPG